MAKSSWPYHVSSQVVRTNLASQASCIANFLVRRCSIFRGLELLALITILAHKQANKVNGAGNNSTWYPWRNRRIQTRLKLVSMVSAQNLHEASAVVNMAADRVQSSATQSTIWVQSGRPAMLEEALELNRALLIIFEEWEETCHRSKTRACPTTSAMITYLPCPSQAIVLQ